MLEKIVGLCLENIKIEMEIKLDDEEWKLMRTHRPYTVHTHFSFRNPYPFNKLLSPPTQDFFNYSGKRAKRLSTHTHVTIFIINC